MDSDLDSFINSFTYKSKDKTKCETPKEKPGQNSRELNPYWKNGGTGLPSKNDSCQKSSSTAGDGGLSWWTKALKRCKEAAEEQGKSVEEVASERYGSLEYLHNKIKEAELYLSSTGRSSYSDRKDNSQWKGRSFVRPNDLGESDYYSGRSHGDDRKRDSRNSERNYYLDRNYEDDSRKKDERNNERGQGSKRERAELATTQECPQRTGKDRNTDSQQARNIRQEEPPRITRVETVTQEHPIVQLSAEERNKISAKLLRAELMGDKDLAKQLKAMLDGSIRSESRKEKRRATEREDDHDDKEILVLQNHRGGAVPFVDKKFAEEGRRKKHKLETHRDGQRVKYFHDDEQKTLEMLVKEEKLSRGNSDLDMVNRMARKGSRVIDDDETIDDEMLRNETRNKPSKMFSKEKQLAIIEQNKMSFKIGDCPFCFKNIQKHLIISMGTKALLCLPRSKSMVPGHCLIVALQHVVQSTACDEDVLEEINMYKRSLVRMFEKDDEDVIFMETCKNLKNYPHLVIECIPVPREIGDTAPVYFQKAINECGPEWSNNKKLVKIKGGVKRSIPRGFPYFHVGFGMEDGYGHVIEDEESFPWYFGREIIGGLLDLEPTLWRKPRFDDFDEQRRKVLEFTNSYKSFDPLNSDKN